MVEIVDADELETGDRVWGGRGAGPGFRKELSLYWYDEAMVVCMQLRMVED